MTTYGAAVNQDVNGIKTTSEYGNRGDGTNTWFQYVRLAEQIAVSASALGLPADAAVYAPSSSASIPAALKGLLGLTTVSTSSQAASAIANGSGLAANATATATLVAGGSGKRTWVTKVVVSGGGATAAALVNLTITGLTGGTRTYTIGVPAGATVGLAPIVLDFDGGFPASADNTPIVATLDAFGAGNTAARVNIFGFVR